MPFAYANLGKAHALRGEFEIGLKFILEADRLLQSLGVRVPHSFVVIFLGDTYRMMGRLEEAFVAGMRALTITRDYGEKLFEAEALRLLGEIEAQRNSSRPEVAESHFRHSLEIAQTGEYRMIEAHCHLGLGRIGASSRRRQQARESFACALAMYREMKLDNRCREVERELLDLQ